MSNLLNIQTRNIRGTDTNSLLRMYDLAKEIFSMSRVRQERAKADKAIQRITQELRRRNVSL